MNTEHYYTRKELIQLGKLLSYSKTDEKLREYADITYLQAVDLINKTVSIISELGEYGCDIISKSAIVVDDKELIIPNGLNYKAETNYQITKREDEIDNLMKLILDSDDMNFKKYAKKELKTLLDLKDDYIFTLSHKPQDIFTKRFLSKSMNLEEFCLVAKSIKLVVNKNELETRKKIEKIQSDFSDGEEAGYLLDRAIDILKHQNTDLLKKIMDMDGDKYTDEDCLFVVFEHYGLEK